MNNEVNTPFSDEQVKNLNAFQNEGRFHPFTCCSGDESTPNCQRRAGTSEGILIATNEGWVCPCGQYKQDWAHSFMIQPRINFDEIYPTPRKPAENDVLVMYLIVNNTLNMGPGKIAAQCGHAVHLATMTHNKNKTRNIALRFSYWEDQSLNGGFRKVVLKADQKEFDKLKEIYHPIVVVDAGLTEVEPGSETVLALFPMFKDERDKLLKRLQALK